MYAKIAPPPRHGVRNFIPPGGVIPPPGNKYCVKNMQIQNNIKIYIHLYISIHFPFPYYDFWLHDRKLKIVTLCV